MISQRPHQAGNGGRRRRFADLAQRLHGLGAHPIVAIRHRLDQGRGGLFGCRADGPEGLGRLGSHDVVRADQPFDQGIGGRLVKRSHQCDGLSRRRAHGLLPILQERYKRRDRRFGRLPQSTECPRRRRLDRSTGVLEQLDQCGHRGPRFAADLAQCLGCLAPDRFVRLLQQADEPGRDRRGPRPDPAQRLGGLDPHRCRFVRQGRLQGRNGQIDRVAGSCRRDSLPPPGEPRDPTPFRATASGEASLREYVSRPRAAEVPQGFDHALPHHVAGVLGECGQRGNRFQGVELAEGGGDDGPHVLVRVVQMTDQSRDDRGADRFQDQRQLVPLLLGQRWDRAQRPQQRPDGQGTVTGQRISGPFVNRLVRAPEIGDRLGQQFPLPQGGKDLMQARPW